MDTKMQSLPITHAQNRSSSWHHSHNCSQCHCDRHGQGYSRRSSQGPASHHSPPGHRSHSPSSSQPSRHHKHTAHCNHSMRPTTCYYTYSNKRKIWRGMNKRKAKRNQQRHRTKRWSSGQKCN